MRHILLLGLLASVVVACSPPEPKETSVIGEPLQRALERAESVGATLDERADALRRELEEAEGGSRREE